MPGSQQPFAIRGAQHEDDAQSLLSRLGAPVKVPREYDFGIDFFVQPYSAGRPNRVETGATFAVQIKGPTEDLKFGGERDGTWRSYEIEWLRSQAQPLLLGRVHAGPTLDLYLLSPLWRVLWQTAHPFQIACTSQAYSEGTEFHYTDVTFDTTAAAPGDGRSWTAPLGGPILRLTHAELADDRRRAELSSLLRHYLAMERANLLAFHQGVALHRSPLKWTTNRREDPYLTSDATFWSPTPGENIAALATALQPALVSLGIHLQHQGDASVADLIPTLKWLERRGYTGPFGKGLLDTLTSAPAPPTGQQRRD